MDLLSLGTTDEDLISAFAELEKTFFSQFLRRIVSPPRELQPSLAPLDVDSCPPGSLPCTEKRAVDGLCVPGEGLNIFNSLGEECFSKQEILRANIAKLREDASKPKKKEAKTDARQIALAVSELSKVMEAAAKLNTRLTAIGRSKVTCAQVNDFVKGDTEAHHTARQNFCGTLVTADGKHKRCSFVNNLCTDSTGVSAVAAAVEAAVESMATPAAVAVAAQAVATSGMPPAQAAAASAAEVVDAKVENLSQEFAAANVAAAKEDVKGAKEDEAAAAKEAKRIEDAAKGADVGAEEARLRSLVSSLQRIEQRSREAAAAAELKAEEYKAQVQATQARLDAVSSQLKQLQQDEAEDRMATLQHSQYYISQMNVALSEVEILKAKLEEVQKERLRVDPVGVDAAVLKGRQNGLEAQLKEQVEEAQELAGEVRGAVAELAKDVGPAARDAVAAAASIAVPAVPADEVKVLDDAAESLAAAAAAVEAQKKAVKAANAAALSKGVKSAAKEAAQDAALRIVKQEFYETKAETLLLYIEFETKLAATIDSIQHTEKANLANEVLSQVLPLVLSEVQARAANLNEYANTKFLAGGVNYSKESVKKRRQNADKPITYVKATLRLKTKYAQYIGLVQAETERFMQEAAKANALGLGVTENGCNCITAPEYSDNYGWWCRVNKDCAGGTRGVGGRWDYVSFLGLSKQDQEAFRDSPSLLNLNPGVAARLRPFDVQTARNQYPCADFNKLYKSKERRSEMCLAQKLPDGNPVCGYDEETNKCMELDEYNELLGQRAAALEAANAAAEKSAEAAAAAPEDEVKAAVAAEKVAEQNEKRLELVESLKDVPGGHGAAVSLGILNGVAGAILEDPESGEAVDTDALRTQLEQAVELFAEDATKDEQALVKQQAKATRTLLGSIKGAIRRNPVKAAIAVGLLGLAGREAFSRSQGTGVQPKGATSGTSLAVRGADAFMNATTVVAPYFGFGEGGMVEPNSPAAMFAPGANTSSLANAFANPETTVILNGATQYLGTLPDILGVFPAGVFPSPAPETSNMNPTFAQVLQATPQALAFRAFAEPGSGVGFGGLGVGQLLLEPAPPAMRAVYNPESVGGPFLQVPEGAFPGMPGSAAGIGGPGIFARMPAAPEGQLYGAAAYQPSFPTFT